jgi:preprotein translocase subunit SecY
MASGILNIGKVPELRRRLLITLGLLFVYRVGIFISVPGVDREVMGKIMAQSSGGFMGLFNMFSGGALEQLSIFSLGIMPYISSSIILQLLTVVSPTLAELRKEGEVGYRRINQYTRYGTVLISFIQSIGIALYIEGLNRTSTFGAVVHDPGFYFKIMTMVTLTSGTCFLMWLGEQITEKGIGNGISLIIFAGIVARLPAALFQTTTQAQMGQIQPLTLLFIVLVVIAVIGVIVFFERGQRRLTIQYPRRMVGRKVYGGGSTHLPLRVNQSGVIPPIFASSILLFPSTLAGFGIPGMANLQNVLVPGDWRYNVMYVIAIVFFCYLYTAITFQPDDVADNLKKQGAFIPGIRPGKKTAEYINHVMSRITFGGALYVSAVCVLPTFLQKKFHVPFYFGGTSIMIVVGVALDTVQQIESHLITRHYEGFTGPRGPRIRGRRGGRLR